MIMRKARVPRPPPRIQVMEIKEIGGIKYGQKDWGRRIPREHLRWQ